MEVWRGRNLETTCSRVGLDTVGPLFHCLWWFKSCHSLQHYQANAQWEVEWRETNEQREHVGMQHRTILTPIWKSVSKDRRDWGISIWYNLCIINLPMHDDTIDLLRWCLNLQWGGKRSLQSHQYWCGETPRGRKENIHLLTQQEPEMRHWAIGQLGRGPSCQTYLQREGLTPRLRMDGIKGCPPWDRTEILQETLIPSFCKGIF